jgi:hypothetical protein
MKPEVDVVLQSIVQKLLTDVAPAIGDEYVRSNVEVMAGLLAAAAEEFDRAAEVRVQDNEGMRRIFREVVPSLPELDLRERLEAAAKERDASVRVRDLNVANDRLRALLIELQTYVETREEDWARRANRAIWEELRASTERRAISLWPL